VSGRIAIAVLTAREIFDLVRDDLIRVEEELAVQAGTAFEPVAEIGQYLLEGGGKRLRPALVLLSARFCGATKESAIRMGAVVELIHSATLVHDDVIDAADTRRGRPSTNSRWGNHMSVLAGDWMYMQSFRLALAERNFRVLDILIELTQKMVEGELLQYTRIGRMEQTEDDALDLAYRKTACLLSGCAQLGAVLAGRGPEIESALAEYGRCAGLEFQLVDDLLDFTASHQQLGKPVLNDLKQGKVTLPLIYALEKAGPRERQMVGTVLSEGGFSSVRAEEISDFVRSSGAIERTRSLAQKLAMQAKNSVNGHGDPDSARALQALPDFILERES
jgi:octaprenyl-diphosphate synthase